jgi:hypothetical protein
MSTMSASGDRETHEQQAFGAHRLVSRTLGWFGLAATVAGVVLHVREADLHFLTPLDVIVIGLAMIAAGVWVSRGPAT